MDTSPYGNKLCNNSGHLVTFCVDTYGHAPPGLYLILGQKILQFEKIPSNDDGHLAKPRKTIGDHKILWCSVQYFRTSNKITSQLAILQDILQCYKASFFIVSRDPFLAHVNTTGQQTVMLVPLACIFYFRKNAFI